MLNLMYLNVVIFWDKQTITLTQDCLDLKDFPNIDLCFGL